jgi:S-adenosylmethionine:tRNA ribosyltransferase-isomerase
MRTADFDFDLPPALIAQHPAPRRDESRLLVLHRGEGRIEHRKFRGVLDLFRAGDVLVLNNSRVIPARLHGRNARSGGRFEILLLEETARNLWWAMLRPAKRARIGTEIVLHDANGRTANVRARVLEMNEEGHRLLEFSGAPDVNRELEWLGEVPLPPYITRTNADGLGEDRERYQTVFAKTDGSIAAPTAGLHFTPDLLQQLRVLGVSVCFVTLHVGAGTFLPVTAEMLAGHRMHEERFELDEETARAVNAAKAAGHRIIAVGTTSVRVLESIAARNSRKLAKTSGKTGIFIHPPFRFQVVDGLLTNFHLPRSTLLMLVSAFAAPGQTTGRQMILNAYAEAIRERYRFYSYGDAMLIL